MDKIELKEQTAVSLFTNNSAYWMRSYKGFNLLLGNVPALFLNNLIDKTEYFQSKNQLDKNGFFFITKSWIEIETGINKTTQAKIIQNLEKLNLIETKMQGIPPKKYYKVNFPKICELLETIQDIRKMYLEKNEDRAVISPEDLLNYKTAVRNISINDTIPRSLKTNYNGHNQPLTCKTVKECNVLHIDPNSTTCKTNIIRTKDNNTKKNIIINNNIITEFENSVDTPLSKKNNKDKKNLLNNNKIKNKDNTPYSNNFKLTEYNNLLKTEYPEIIKLFFEYKLNFQTGRNTKVCEFVYTSLRQLEAGTFLKHKKIEGKFYDIARAKKMLNSPWTKNQLHNRIKRVLNRYHELFYNPEYKHPKVKPNVQNFFYNSFSNTSYFMQFLVQAPQPQAELIPDIQYKKILTNLEKIGFSFTILAEKIYNNNERVFKYNSEQKKKFIFTVWELRKWWKANLDNFKLFKYPFSWVQFLEYINRYILESRSDTRPEILQVGGSSWKYFCDWLYTFNGVDLNFTDGRIIRKKKSLSKLPEKVYIPTADEIEERACDIAERNNMDKSYTFYLKDAEKELLAENRKGKAS